MTYICSAGLGIPDNPISQEKVKSLVQDIFPTPDIEVEKLLPVFDHAEIKERQLVVDEAWFKEKHTFEEKNNLYQKLARKYSLIAIEDCLSNQKLLKQNIPYEAVDMIIFVSSTGIATPSLDVHLMNDLPFRRNIARMPLWGLGCAGGAIGLSRANDFITAYPEKTVLIVCCELCSLTFQKDDVKMSNLIGTALFGDGISSVLLMGKDSPYFSFRKNRIVPKITKTSSFTKKDSVSVMGWDITNDGLEVVFSKRIPELVNTLWKDHIETFLRESSLQGEQIHSFIAHPGGKKVLAAMENTLSIPREKLANSYKVLANHGNMSSATVFYVLKEWLEEHIERKQTSILSALGPGFSSELLLLEWDL